MSSFLLFGLSHPIPEGGKKKQQLYNTAPSGETLGRSFKLFVALVVEVGTLSELIKEAKEMVSTRNRWFPQMISDSGGDLAKC